MTGSETATEFGVPADERYFEDYKAGASYEFGTVTVSEQEIIEFAAKYDPQPFHLDPAAAEHGPFGALVASGWHSCGLMMRLFAKNYLSPVASLGSPGVDELRWLKPVRPGARLRLRVRILDTRLSRSDPRRGIVRTLAELVGEEDGEPVLRVTVVSMMRARGTGSGDE